MDVIGESNVRHCKYKLKINPIEIFGLYLIPTIRYKLVKMGRFRAHYIAFIFWTKALQIRVIINGSTRT